MKTLTLPLKATYFDQIKAGTKTEEYRRCTDFWIKRIGIGEFDRIVLTKGYPAASDKERRIERPWRGYEIKAIEHPHFGEGLVTVFAIKVN